MGEGKRRCRSGPWDEGAGGVLALDLCLCVETNTQLECAMAKQGIPFDNALQHTVTHCNTLLHTATHCSTL